MVNYWKVKLVTKDNNTEWLRDELVLFSSYADSYRSDKR
jgi:hypothetical protein